MDDAEMILNGALENHYKMINEFKGVPGVLPEKLAEGMQVPEMEFKEFEPWFKSAKTRFKLSAGLNLETFDTILSGTNHI